jgi:hypothetical protein
VFLVLGVILAATILSRGLVHRWSDAIIAVAVVGGVALLAINNFLSAAAARIVVDGDNVVVRDWLGRERRFDRVDVDHAARRSIFAPAQSGISQEEFFLVGSDGRCLLRLSEADYGESDLQRFVEALGIKWPSTHKASVRQIRREIPGAYGFDYQTTTIVAVILLVAILAAAAFVSLTR